MLVTVCDVAVGAVAVAVSAVGPVNFDDDVGGYENIAYSVFPDSTLVNMVITFESVPGLLLDQLYFFAVEFLTDVEGALFVMSELTFGA